MEQIYPLHEDHIKRYCGMPVCVVTHDGQRHVGVLSRCHEGRVTLNERPNSIGAHGGQGGQATSGVQQGKVTNQKSAKQNGVKQKKGKTASGTKAKESVQTQAYYPYDPYGYGYGDYGYGYGYGGFGFGEALAFDLASIAFLFLLI